MELLINVLLFPMKAEEKFVEWIKKQTKGGE
ncbi:MAG: hypothetical protein MASP_00518 [Candidatus Methanolliviera sp. GoM_asphalt]|nr:MAG: hypothetical protein MASP_00518 [Candidatus Methanolliviera sp. GoM_asphalt]